MAVSETLNALVAIIYAGNMDFGQLRQPRKSYFSELVRFFSGGYADILDVIAATNRLQPRG
jgi:hypothetical protein